MGIAANGIDVSKHQGKIDWSKAKKAIDFAIIRVGYGWDNDEQVDSEFLNNVNGCIVNNIPFGIYHYSYAWSIEDARCEARWLLKLIKGLKPEYPIFWDYEEAFQIGGSNSAGFSVSKQMDMIDAWMEVMEEAGYYCAVYSTGSAIKRLRDSYASRMSKYSTWVAHVNVSQPMTAGDIWQYSWNGKIDGISGAVDMNYAYKDFPSMIKTAGLNGWNKIEQPNKDLLSVERSELKSVYNSVKNCVDMLAKVLGG